MHVRIVDSVGSHHPNAWILGHEDRAGQPVAQYRDWVAQIERDLPDDSSSARVDEQRTVRADSETRVDVEFA